MVVEKVVLVDSTTGSELEVTVMLSETLAPWSLKLSVGAEPRRSSTLYRVALLKPSSAAETL